MATSPESKHADPDSHVTLARVWLIRAAIALTAAASLGTSPGTQPPGTSEPVGPAARLEKTEEAPDAVELTADTPRVQFLVKLQANDLGPDMSVTTADATALVQGNITSSGVMGNVPQLHVQVVDSSPDAGFHETMATGSFGLEHQLLFAGGCEDPSTGTCSASFGVELSRSDDGQSGGSLNVTWGMKLTSHIHTEAGGSDTAEQVVGEPPWTVEIIPL